MNQERADSAPIPSPSLSVQDLCFPFLHCLSLQDDPAPIEDNGAHDEVRTIYSRIAHTKLIGKDCEHKRNAQKQKSMRTKENNKRKIQSLQRIIHELESENDKLKRKIDCCAHCSGKLSDQAVQFLAQAPGSDHQNVLHPTAENSGAGLKRDSHGSLEFENIEFHAPNMDREFDERSWVFLGTAMIAMGSKCLEVDGTINVFKILKESVDSLRRQVEKSEPNINIDFYLSKEEMGENHFMNEIGFDPFIHKEHEQGLALEGVRVESVEQFELTYDSKLTFGLKYEALLGAMEYIREHSWIAG